MGTAFVTPNHVHLPPFVQSTCAHGWKSSWDGGAQRDMPLMRITADYTSRRERRVRERGRRETSQTHPHVRSVVVRNR